MNKYSRQTTLLDIANNLGISVSTVSRALNNNSDISKDTREKVIRIAAQMNYYLNSNASNLRTKQSRSIGVIIPRVNERFTADVLAGMEDQANEGGYTIVIRQSHGLFNRELASVQSMIYHRVAGLVVSLGSETANLSHFDQLLHQDVPVILFDHVIRDKRIPSMTIDNFKAAHEITCHLVKQGCRSIAHVAGSLKLDTYKERLEGYKKALRDYHLPFDQEHLIIGDPDGFSGYQAAKRIFQIAGRIDGVLVADDTATISCMQHLKSMGIQIPQDIAFACLNNDATSNIPESGLTAINFDGYGMGRAIITRMIESINNKRNAGYAHDILLNQDLVIRASSQKRNCAIP